MSEDQSDITDLNSPLMRETLLILLNEKLQKMTTAELLRLTGRLDAAGYWH
jgi:hypothetical protein